MNNNTNRGGGEGAVRLRPIQPAGGGGGGGALRVKLHAQKKSI